ncbi:MAG: SLC13 family permease [alpha proteobacterium MED-G10]|mgnify:FL=1|nr:MAG: SLC13 family permease [alpha proteobacterium MED-G10]|tara:strand:- start:460 stop:2286 length:1827 start_codon:yes stop_codon:yes gene_type:complete
MFNLENQTFIYLSLLIAFSSMVFYAIDKFSMAFKSIVILTFLLIFFSIFPFKGATDVNLLNPQSILNGFSNTSLITVISLLILGQGVVNTRVLDGFISNLLKYFPDNTQLIIIVCLFFVLVLSAFINNTPVVIIFIPILQSVVKNSNQSIGKYLMPLSFVAILGGMITIIGSSTNLLVSDSLKTYSNFEISFFEFAIPGSIIAFCGLIYVVIFSKFLLTDRSPISNQLIKDKKNNFITKIIVNENSNLIGKKADEDKLEGLENSEILMIQRGEHAEHTPFYSFVMEKGDILVISTSREQLTSILSKNIGSIESFDENEDDSETKKQVITEAMVTPSSSLVGNTIENVSFRYRYDCIVIGLQRKSKIITTNMGELPLEPGDTLLIQGDKKSIKALRTKSDLLPMEWTTSEIQNKNIAKISIFIFLCVIIFGAFEILPLVVASLIGVVTMIASKVLSLRQALRSVDNNLLLLIVTSLALGKVIQVTGAATFLSEYLLDILDGSSPLTILICFYALVSITTNFISNNACAVLFAPIAIDIAEKIDVDPKIFAIALIFSVNTSFATPLAYQTNLLVMGPGHYKFIDYVKFGLPLTILCWVVFFFVFPFIYKI